MGPKTRHPSPPPCEQCCCPRGPADGPTRARSQRALGPSAPAPAVIGRCPNKNTPQKTLNMPKPHISISTLYVYISIYLSIHLSMYLCIYVSIPPLPKPARASTHRWGMGSSFVRWMSGSRSPGHSHQFPMPRRLGDLGFRV